MCGIFGFVGDAPLPDLQTCARSLTHRGPDGFGDWVDERRKIYFAHCRLAVIDLSERGSQPMIDPQTGSVIVFNGEIYNYRTLRAELQRAGHEFQSDSDTEVFLTAWREWGTACFSRLRGMFAAAVRDAVNDRIILVRDRIGIKPLYWMRKSDHFGFASEPRALLPLSSVSRTVNSDALASYIAYGYCSGENSVWDDLKKVKPGSFIELDLDSGAVRTESYWQLPTESHRMGINVASEELSALLSESVAEHVISDVPLGLFLSGGLDSSAVAMFASKHSPGVAAVTVDFEDWGSNETEIARLIAEHLRLQHLTPSVGRHQFTNPFEVLSEFDVPVADTAHFSNDAVCRAIRPHATVALSGDGGDELLAGYRWYQQLQFRRVRRRIAFAAERTRRFLGVGRDWPEGCEDDWEYYRLLTSPGFSPENAVRMFPALTTDHFRRLRANFFETTGRSSQQFKRWQLFDFHNYLPENNLARADRISMAYSLEVRVPLLDHRIVEFAFSLPDKLCVSNGVGKQVLRRVLAKGLPATVLNHPKQGFSCPVETLWSKSEMIQSVLEGSLIESDLADGDEIRRFIGSEQHGTWWYRLWSLVMMEVWHRRWVDGSIECLPIPSRMPTGLVV